MAYSPQTWVDGSGGGTPVTAARLAFMEAGIDDADTRLTTLEATGGAGGTVQWARKASGVWPARPSSSTAVMVIWVGPDPSPAVVGSGTGGMYNNDLRVISAT